MEVGLRLRLRALGHCCGLRGGFPPAACSRHLRPHRGVSSSTAFCSLAASVSGAAVGPVGSGAEVARAKRMLHVVLVFPLIPGRKYRINSEDVCSVGSWPASCRGKIHDSWDEFRDYFMKQDGGKKRLLAFTKRGTNIHSDFSYKPGDWLVFGSETKGLPQSALDDCCREGLGGGTVRIPMVETYVRCLNLLVSVGMALYEAARQLNYEQLQYQPELPEEAQGCSQQRIFMHENTYLRIV